MNHRQLESLVDGLADLRATEKQNRELAFLGWNSTICGADVVALTPWHRLALRLIKNAFGYPLETPGRGDVFQVLWLLSPRNIRGRKGNQLLAAFWQWKLRRQVRSMDMTKARREIRAFLRDQSQDSPEGGGGNEDVDQSPWVAAIARDATFWINVHGGFTLETYLATPYLVLQQLYRAWRCNHPDVTTDRNGETIVTPPSFINDSDRLVGAWHQKHRAAVAEAIQKQTVRL